MTTSSIIEYSVDSSVKITLHGGCRYHSDTQRINAMAIRALRESLDEHLSMVANNPVRIIVKGMFSFTNNEQVKDAMCEFVDKYPFTHLYLESMDGPAVDPLLEEVIMKALGKCPHLFLSGDLSDAVILTLTDRSGQHVAVETVSFTNMNNVEDNRLAGIIEMLANVNSTIFGSGMDLSNKPLTWRALGQLLSSPLCRISSLELCGTSIQQNEAVMKGHDHRDDRLKIMFDSMTTINESLKRMIVDYPDGLENELFSLSRNLFKLSRLEYLQVNVPRGVSFEFLQPLLWTHHASGEENNHHPVPSSLEEIKFHENHTPSRMGLSKQHQDMLIQLAMENPTLSQIHGVCNCPLEYPQLYRTLLETKDYPSRLVVHNKIKTLSKIPLLEHHLRMNSKWRQFLATNETSIFLSLWPLVIAAVEREHQANNGDEVVASIRYAMVVNLANYGYLE